MENILKLATVLLLLSACGAVANTNQNRMAPSVHTAVLTDSVGLETATLAGGCFWKMDACYQQLEGVKKVEVGYAGGQKVNPTYEEVCSDETGHAETVQVVFDPKVISFKQIIDIFWSIHDPTILNREGNDVGIDYRSEVFYRSEAQKETAQIVKDSLLKIGLYSKIVTPISPYLNFYRAEEYHQDYYNLHPNESYTYNVVRLKVEHFVEKYKNLLRKNP
jgi:peptide-methionine (S)-S-oxide reductase